MRKLSPFLLVLLMLFACGQNPDKPVYDITSNPANFPPVALELLGRIQSDSLMSADSVMELFSNLYMTDQSLLDNEQWKEVVRKLGVRFRYQADLMVEEGIAGYSRAAAYYMLAFCARPDDPKAKELVQLFSRWNDSMAAVTAPLLAESHHPVTRESIVDRLHLVKRFMFQDSLSYRFARDYLVERLLGDLRLKENLPFSLGDSLSAADMAFASYLGLASADLGKPAVEFMNPAIDLMLVEITRFDSLRCLAEMYFVPREHVDTDYEVALWIGTADSVVTGGISGSRHLPFDLKPTPGTSAWKVGKVAAACRYFDYGDDIAVVSAGLYRPAGEGVRYLPVSGSDASIVSVPFSLTDGK